MEVDLQSLFGLQVTWCAQLYSLAETPHSLPPPAFGLVLRGRYWSAKIDDISLYPPATAPLAGVVTIYAKTTVHCSSDFSMFNPILCRVLPWSEVEGEVLALLAGTTRLLLKAFAQRSPVVRLPVLAKRNNWRFQIKKRRRFMDEMHKVHISRVPRCPSPPWDWDPLIPSPTNESALLPGTGGWEGGIHSPTCEGVGSPKDSQFGRLERKLLCLLMLCDSWEQLSHKETWTQFCKELLRNKLS